MVLWKMPLSLVYFGVLLWFPGAVGKNLQKPKKCVFYLKKTGLKREFEKEKRGHQEIPKFFLQIQHNNNLGFVGVKIKKNKFHPKNWISC